MGCHWFDAHEFAEDCDAPTVMSVNGLDYCRPHGRWAMLQGSKRRPVCEYFNNVTSICLRNVFDGRPADKYLCDLHWKWLNTRGLTLAEVERIDALTHKP